MQAGYVTSPYFKNIYSYLTKSKLPSSKAAIRHVESQAEKYSLLDSLLLWIQLLLMNKT